MPVSASSLFTQEFVQENLMGPSCLLIAQELVSHLTLPKNPRILDLGCGTGLTSMYFSHTYSAQVFATDLWIDPTENLKRFIAQGYEKTVFPIHAAAHELPYAHNYFDAIISVDSYHYFGADPDYLEKFIVPLVKPGGIIAVSIPGVREGLTEVALPEEMKAFWNYEVINFNSLTWWENLWGQCKSIERIHTFHHTCHDIAWAQWLSCDNPYAKQDRSMMEAEGGNYFATIGLIYRKTDES
jgi:cyclopropane fatty-acyl-phospholipid synthase-like methyltransferase